MSASPERAPVERANTVLFTDLDGTLLDSVDYSYTKSIDAVKRLQSMGIPIIFCSSKTRAEQEVYRRDMGIEDPFIVEDGSAVLIPEGYLSHPLNRLQPVDGYRAIELGVRYGEIRRVTSLLERRLGVRSFSSMSDEEVADVTGLDRASAALAKEREYSETLMIDPHDVPMVMEVIEHQGLTATFGGRFHTVKGATDKGKAARHLLEVLTADRGPIRSFGIGDSENDLPMAAEVDDFFLVGGESGVASYNGESTSRVADFSHAVSIICAAISD